jgi:hypothetical protein
MRQPESQPFASMRDPNFILFLDAVLAAWTAFVSRSEQIAQRLKLRQLRVFLAVARARSMATASRPAASVAMVRKASGDFGIPAPGILNPVVMRRARKRKSSSSAWQYEQSDFVFTQVRRETG